MTDPFEDAVRNAARGLSATSEQPTYHDAWGRGRRRKLTKQVSMAFAGGLVLFVALSVNLGRFPGSGTTTEFDVADSIDGATQATTTPVPTSPAFLLPPATTAPVVVVPGDDEADPPAASADEADAPTGAVDSTPVPDSAVAAQSVPAPTTPPGSVGPTAAPVATAEPAAELAPTAVPLPATDVPQDEDDDDVPAPSDLSASQAADDDLDEDNVDSTSPSATGFTTDPAEVPGPAAAAERDPDDGSEGATTTNPNGPADAVLLEPVDLATAKCEIKDAALSNATCELLPPYPCESDAQLTPGYQLSDLDADGRPDTCVAANLTTCDTTGDGLGDTPCIIEIAPTVEPADTDNGDPDDN